MSYSYAQFMNTIAGDYDRRRAQVFAESAFSASSGVPETRALGHPRFEGLRVGQRENVTLAVAFLDLTAFTRRSFWDGADQVADLAHAILTGFVEVVGQFGGHALGLRGDGVFAGFGPGPSGTMDATMALGACAFALNGVKEEVNPWLTSRGIEPVLARAGVDYGEITFVRTGSASANEVNPIGFAANFAAKCEKHAKSWEIVVGEGAVSELGDALLCVEHAQSPKEFWRRDERRYYRFYDYRWHQTLPALPGVVRELAGMPVTSVTSA